MSKRFRSLLAVMLALSVPAAFARQDQGAAAPRLPSGLPVVDATKALYRPALRPLTEAVAAANLDKMEAVVDIDYDASGKVTEARLIKSSGRTRVDKAAVAWAKGLRLQPGQAGVGRIPFDFKVE